MSTWNKQASRNNNLPPNMNIKSESIINKKIQNNIQEQNGMEPNEQEELLYNPQSES
ncbi:hypothetical protein [Sutcliffiella cohnii]|uniref:hypothetical protein n=1 Tax=Sutcliffiella cohnii TaxID=33932 RepID=UPI002E20B32C|nr:hypothetical protein [Sutcliffiella cohnii]